MRYGSNVTNNYRGGGGAIVESWGGIRPVFCAPLVDACSFLRNPIHETCVTSLPSLNQTRKLAQTIALLTYI
jgi:hypothetical protein